jgi:hypothetical protein
MCKPYSQKAAARKWNSQRQRREALHEPGGCLKPLTGNDIFQAMSDKDLKNIAQPRDPPRSSASHWTDQVRSEVEAVWSDTVGAARVAKQVTLGAAQQVWEHPLETAKDVGIGVGATGLAVVAEIGAPTAAGIAALPAEAYVTYNEIGAGVTEGIDGYRRHGALGLAIQQGFIASADYMDGLAAAVKEKGHSLLSAGSTVFRSDSTDPKLSESEVTLRGFGAGAVPVVAGMIGGSSRLGVDGLQMAAKFGNAVGNEIHNLRVPGVPTLEPAYARVGNLADRLPYQPGSQPFDPNLGLSAGLEAPLINQMVSADDSGPVSYNSGSSRPSIATEDPIIRSEPRSAAGALLSDVAGTLAKWVPDYPLAERLLKEPLEGLRSAFLRQRNDLASALEPASSFLPQLGLHGTSLEGGSTMLATRTARPLDFATFPADSAKLGMPRYVSEVGSSMETGVLFSEKWLRNFGRDPGPVLVMDISKARGMKFSGVDVHREAQLLGVNPGEDPLLAPFSLPEARKFEGTIYNLSNRNFPQIVSGVVDYTSTQRAQPLFDLLNKIHIDKLADGVPQADLVADLGARSNYVAAVRRLDYAHQAISKWLTVN